MNTFPIGMMKIKTKKKPTFYTKYVSILTFVCDLLSQHAWAHFFFFWATFLTVNGDNTSHSGSTKLGDESGNKERRFLRRLEISSKLTSASGRPNGQNFTLLFTSYLLKRVATISVAAAKRSARASCTNTCTWKNEQMHSYNCLYPSNFRQRHFPRT